MSPQRAGESIDTRIIAQGQPHTSCQYGSPSLLGWQHGSPDYRRRKTPLRRPSRDHDQHTSR